MPIPRLRLRSTGLVNHPRDRHSSLADRHHPDPSGSVLVNTHTEGHVRVWCAAYQAWTERGVSRRQFMALRHQTRYRHPSVRRDLETDGGRVVAWVRFGTSVHGRRVAAVANAFKRAVYARYRDAHGDLPPVWFHGHGLSGNGGEWQLARVRHWKTTRCRIHAARACSSISPAATASIVCSASSTSGGSGSHLPPLRSTNMTSEAQAARLLPSGSG